MPSSPFKNTPPADKLDFMTMAKAICIRPRPTIRTIVNFDPYYGQRHIILGLSGVSGLLALHHGFEMMVLEFALNLAMLAVSIYGTALLLWWAGKPIGGKANYAKVCAALAWPMVPSLFGVIVAFFLTGIGNDMLANVVQVFFYLYSFHLMILTVAEVQGFSFWTSVLNQLLALLIMLLPLLFFWGSIVQAFQSIAPMLAP